MTTEPSPSIIHQTLIKEPKDKVFQLLRSTKGAEILWFAESSEYLAEHTTVLWHWSTTNTSVRIQVDKVIPNTLISIKWLDTGILMDLICEQITEEDTLITLKAYNFLTLKANYNFEEYKNNLLTALKAQQSMFELALKMLEDYYKFQKPLHQGEKEGTLYKKKITSPITD